MNNFFEVEKINSLSGEIVIPPDKSITHRAIILGALCESKIKIKNISKGADCLATLKIFEKAGAKVEFINERDIILDCTKGLHLKEDIALDCGNSGTSARLLTGLFSGLFQNSPYFITLFGDESLSKRPMKRIIEPLSLMGADIKSRENKLPLKIKSTHLKGICYHSPIASAQVKSSIILAGLNAQNKTKVYEKTLSRNHSEIMLEYLEAKINTGKDENGYYVEIEKSKLTPKDIEISGDISSAAFFMTAAAIIPDSNIIIKNVGINPTRTGIIDIFNRAHVNFELINKRVISNEPVADIIVKYTKNIQPFSIEEDIIPRLIDEIPILAVLAVCAQGKSTIHGAKDLRNKESDRIKTIVESFKMLGIDIVEFEDGFEIEGKNKELNKNITFKTYLDHRLAMSYFVLAQLNKGTSKIEGFDCINTSFPEFLELMKILKL